MSTRKTLTLTIPALLLAASAFATQTTPPPPTPEQILKNVDSRLLAWSNTAARAELAKLPPNAAGTVAAKVARGRLLAQEGKLQEATNELAAAAAAAPTDPSPPIYLGEVHRLAGRAAEAQTSFTQAAERASNGLNSAPNDVRLLVALGVARQNLRQLPEAITALSKARELAPGNTEAIYQLGVCQAQNRDFQKSVDTLTQALQQNSEIAYAYYFRALAAEKIGRKDLLINDLERFLALAPNAPDASRARRLLQAIKG